MTPEQLMEEAADLVEERGLAHNSYITGEGQVCVLGAVYMAAGHSEDTLRWGNPRQATRNRKAVREAWKRILWEIGDESIISWSDRTWHDSDTPREGGRKAAAMLREAADRVDQMVPRTPIPTARRR